MSKAAKQPTKAKADKAQVILMGALEVFKKDGYAAASMERIASVAGVSKPTLYTYFKGGKEGLFVALIQQMAEKNSPTPERLRLASKMQAPPDQVLSQLAMTALDEFGSDRTLLTLMRLIIGESERFPELASTFVSEIAKPNLEALSAYLASQPQLNLPDPMVAARIFIGSIVHYIITQEIMNGSDVMPFDRDRMVKGLVHQMMSGATAS